MEVVASLQRVGADVVASFQFPVEVAASTQGGGGYLPIPEPFRPRSRSEPVEVPRAVRELEERATEIAEATVARAAAVPEAPASLAELMQVWAMPASLSVLVESVSPVLTVSAPEPAQTVTAPPSLAALDEDAIMAASILIMRRRRT